MFDRLYIIHGAHLRERRAHTERELRRLGWSGEWIVSFDPKDISPQTWRERVSNARLTAGEVSVYLKHLAVYRDLVERPVPRAFVIEDDAIFPHDFALTFERYAKALPRDFDAVFFGASGGATVKALRDNPLFGAETGTRSMSGYALTLPCASTLFEELEKRSIEKPVDLTINDVARLRGLKIYWSVPALVENGTETGLFPHSLGVRWRQRTFLSELIRHAVDLLRRKNWGATER